MERHFDAIVKVLDEQMNPITTLACHYYLSDDDPTAQMDRKLYGFPSNASKVEIVAQYATNELGFPLPTPQATITEHKDTE